MIELNRDEIVKALECCIVNDWNSTKCNECPIYNGGGGCIDELKEATLALITSQEQKIFELENRLKECENGYEGTLHIEKAKVKELTEENERLKTELRQTAQKLKTVEELNEKLTADNEWLKRPRYNVHPDGKIEMIPTIESVRADTVREMQHKIWLEFSDCYAEDEICVGSFRASVDEIAKEMVEG